MTRRAGNPARFRKVPVFKKLFTKPLFQREFPLVTEKGGMTVVGRIFGKRALCKKQKQKKSCQQNDFHRFNFNSIRVQISRAAKYLSACS